MKNKLTRAIWMAQLVKPLHSDQVISQGPGMKLALGTLLSGESTSPSSRTLSLK